MSEPTEQQHITLMHWGAFEVITRAGEISAVNGVDEDPAPSPLGDHLLDRSSNRVARPAVRASWLEYGPLANPHLRGDEPLVPVSWDQALDLTHAALARTRREHGNEAIFGGSYGWASAGRFHHAQSQLKRFLNCIGGFVSSDGTYSYGAAEVAVRRILGVGLANYQRSAPSASEIADRTELLVSFGGFPAHNAQITGGGSVVHSYEETLRAAAKRGCRLVSITPTYGSFDAELGAEWIPIRPGTDTALLLGLAGEVVGKNLHDDAFLQRYCSGFEHLLDYLRGATDGVVKGAEWAGEICGIEPSTVETLARALTGQRSMVNATWSTQRVENGEHTFWSLIALGALLGNMHTSGAGTTFGFGSIGSVAGRTQAERLPSLPQGQNPVSASIPVARIADALEHPGGTYVFDGQTKTFPHIDLIYWCGGNPFHHHQDLNRLDRLWRRPSAVIVNEPFWTATAKRADIVLPATIGTERHDIGGGSTDGHLVAMTQAVAPVGEARNDHEIFCELAERFGVKDAFTEGRTTAQWIRLLYDQARKTVPDLPIYDEFLDRRIVDRPMNPVPGPLERFALNPIDSPLATASGRISLALPDLEQPKSSAVMHPRWMPPTESLLTSQAGELHLVTPMPADRLHAQYNHRGEALMVFVHPDDLQRLQLTPGRPVRVYNDRGAFLATINTSEHVRPGVAVAENGQPLNLIDTPDGPICTGGNVKVTTRDQPSSSWAQATTAHSCLVRIEPYEAINSS